MGQMMHGGEWSCGPFGMLGGPWGMILNLVFWGLLIVGVIWLGARLLGRGSSSPGRETPLQALKRRYALGEIDRDEFERMKREITD